MITGERDETGRNTFYMPIIYPNDFWHLRGFTSAVCHISFADEFFNRSGEEEVEINATYPMDPNDELELPLSVTFRPMSFMKMQIFASLAHGFEEAAKTVGSLSVIVAWLLIQSVGSRGW